MKLVDCARDTTSTIGTGDIVLNGQPPIGAQSLSAFEIGEPFEYKVSSLTKNEWEVCVGRRVSALAIRCTEVMSSSANGAKISFTAGVKEVFATISARRLSELARPGRDGIDGRDGVDGVNGKDGADGANGRDGVDGRNGIDGTNGLDGAPGRDGVDGKNGVDGLDGAPGADGQPLDLAALPVADSAGEAAAISLVIVKDGGAGQIPLESIGISLVDLPSMATLADTDLIAVTRPGSGDYKITAAVLKAYAGGTTTPPADTTAPTFPDALSSAGVAQTSFTLSWQAATDANGIARYEYSYDGSTWTTAGTALSVNLSGRTAGTTYTMRVRAVDPSGNVSTVRTLTVTTAAASGDTQAPVMSGSISTSGITASGYTFSWPAGTDNVAIDHYETSIDNGGTWATNGTSLSRTVTGRPASTTDNLRVRAHDAAGNISNVLTATVTTSAAAPVTAYTIAGYNGNAIKETVAASSFEGTGIKRYLSSAAGKQTTVGIYWNINAVTGGAQPVSARSGWFQKGYTPSAADFITAADNQRGDASVNGLREMGKAAAFSNTCNLWVDVGSGDTTWCFWIMPVDGAPFCVNPSGMLVTGG